jgi:hypothetical protein
MIGEEALPGAAPGWCFHLSPLSPETEGPSSRKKLNGDWACLQAAQLEGTIRKIRGNLSHHEWRAAIARTGLPCECTRTMTC